VHDKAQDEAHINSLPERQKDIFDMFKQVRDKKDGTMLINLI
jgi:hypothetical protein